MFRYLIAFTLPAVGYIALRSDGWLTFALVIYGLGIIPVLELIFGQKEKIHTTDPRLSWYYTGLLYLMVPVQYGLLFLFLTRISQQPSVVEFFGLSHSMGVLCGVIGINVGHELGHRKSNTSKAMAHALLLTSLYLHFHIEHNKGHHKRVATPEDPASAPKGMSLYRFWFRTVFGSLISAWQIETTRMERNGFSNWSVKNQMIQYFVIEFVFLCVIVLTFGWLALAGFLFAAIYGILLLETVNYMEHYGLRRKQIKPGIYELTRPEHSWGCDYIISRCLFFELTIHPAHHKNSSVPYQDLISNRPSPYLPTGYAGMVLLALIPLLWFRVMDRRIPLDQIEVDR